MRGILNFVSDGRHDFGQGLITYASSKLSFKSRLQAFQYRICTVADSFRVADDMGKLRCQFKVFHKPIFGFKGSYVVTRLGAERRYPFIITDFSYSNVNVTNTSMGLKYNCKITQLN